MASKMFYCVFSIIAFLNKITYLRAIYGTNSWIGVKTRNESKISTHYEYSDYFCLSGQIKTLGTNFKLTQVKGWKISKNPLISKQWKISNFTVPKSYVMLEVLRKACSERGIFLSAVKIPSSSASSYLRPDRPPVVCAFFLTSAAATAAYLKSVFFFPPSRNHHK